MMTMIAWFLVMTAYWFLREVIDIRVSLDVAGRADAAQMRFRFHGE